MKGYWEFSWWQRLTIPGRERAALTELKREADAKRARAVADFIEREFLSPAPTGER